MSRNPVKLIPSDFPELPGLDELDQLQIELATPGTEVEAIGYVVTQEGSVPPELGFSREALRDANFQGKVGQTLLLPAEDGPDLVAVGAGPLEQLDPNTWRDIAAAFARATSRRSQIALVASPKAALVDDASMQALIEGVILSRYRYVILQNEPDHTVLERLVVNATGADFASAVEAAVVSARSTIVARDVTNTPPGHMTATDLADISVKLGAKFGFDVEVFDKQALIELGCGGLLGVNRGSYEEPRMIKLHYRPGTDPKGHLGLVGKGIMYDSGGVSLKPSDSMHLLMKMDMGGAAAILGAFVGMHDSKVESEVTGWLMCTDNMISGDAYRLGEVLVARNGTTVEVKNTDAEGRLVLMDGISLAVEEDVDAIVDIATLTGAALIALGQSTAPVFASDQNLAEVLLTSAQQVDEPLWQLPLEQKYRPQLNSKIADIANVGDTRFAGSITAALFLGDFTADKPWAHLDIAGTMQTDDDDSWRTAGATGFGARLLLDAAGSFSAAL